MKRRILLSLNGAVIFLAIAIALVNVVPANDSGVVKAAPGKVTQGSLEVLDREGRPRLECPLKHTDVKAEVSGQLARVTVTQEFRNPFRENTGGHESRREVRSKRAGPKNDKRQ